MAEANFNTVVSLPSIPLLFSMSKEFKSQRKKQKRLEVQRLPSKDRHINYNSKKEAEKAKSTTPGPEPRLTYPGAQTMGTTQQSA